MSAVEPAFGLAEAQRLEAVFARRADPAAITYPELAGFLFAIAAAPEHVPPSEWLDLLMEEEPPLIAETKLYEQALPLLTALDAEIRRGVDAGHPRLPAGCEPRDPPGANLNAEAPLSQWARGFLDGHDWVASAWDAEVDDDFDAELEGALVDLCFFATPELAIELHREHGGADESLPAMAARVLARLPQAMATYVGLGREIAAALGEGDET